MSTPHGCALILRFFAVTFLFSGMIQANDAGIQKFLRQEIKLTESEIDLVRKGTAVTRILPSAPQLVVVFGAVYVNSTPAKYADLARNVNALGKVDGYIGVREFSYPPRLSDMEGFTLDPEDVSALKNCKPGECDIQLARATIEQLQSKIDWSKANAPSQVNQFAQTLALERLTEYQKKGNSALGTYQDHEQPFAVAKELEALLVNSKIVTDHLSVVRDFLLKYPEAKPAGTQSWFYWEKVKFGLKPTLRINHAAILKPPGTDPSNVVVVIKQLYASHYFQLALDSTVCVKDPAGSGGNGFYLISIKGSRQEGLTGVKGGLVRKIVVGKAVSSQQSALQSLKQRLEK